MNRAQLLRLVTIGGGLLLAAGLGVGWLLAGGVFLAQPFAGAATAGIFLALAGLGWYLHRFVRAYLRQVHDLAELGRTLLAANPNLRAPQTTTLQSLPDIVALTAVFNALAERYAALTAERVEAIRQGRAEMEEERNLLAALMSELTEGVLACNLEGQILLYNRNARKLLGGAGRSTDGVYVGLGRSIFSVIDRETLAHAIEQVEARRNRLARSGNQDERAIVAGFVTAAPDGSVLRVRLTPFAGAEGQVRGYVLVIQDLSEGIERSLRRDRLLQSLTERTRGSVAAIRAAGETIEQFPTIGQEQRARLHAAIVDEAQALSDHLGETLRMYAGDLRGHWRLEEVHATDLLLSLQHHLETGCGVTSRIAAVDDALWLKADSYTLLRGLGQALGQLVDIFALQHVELRLSSSDAFAALDLTWAGSNEDMAAWDAWKHQALLADDSDGVLSLREVADRHGGEVWVQRAPGAAEASIRLLLPLAAPPLRMDNPDTTSPDTTSLVNAAAQLPSRPEYYDFDLFQRTRTTPDDALLAKLVCTVFDTETTGLVPDYDEIISIGALRIVNGRMLRQEMFEQLIDPRRPVPETAIAVHGITDAMLTGQPPIERVLPRFYEFARDTVLVGHNLAFDLRMFAAKEPATGVRFDQPVLDTLLLSAVVHPQADSHSLEAIAERLGLRAIGRHTALGDAILTGEIFLHLLPLLAAQGITTLREAQTASQQSYLARLRY